MDFQRKNEFFKIEKEVQSYFEEYYLVRQRLSPKMMTHEDLKRELLKRDKYYRSILIKKVSGTPIIKYRVSKNYSKKYNSLSVTIKRSSNLQLKIYKDFKFKLSLKDFSLEEVESVFKKQKEVYFNVLRETLLLKNILSLNTFISKRLKGVDSPFKVMFTPNVFSNKYVEFISDEKLVLTADFDSIFEILEDIASKNNIELDKFEREEEDHLLLSHSTVEILERKTPLIKKLMNASRCKPKKMLSLPFTKTLNQMIVYPNSKGYAYFLDSSVFGVAERDDYSARTILSPIDLNTLEPVEDMDLMDFFNQ